MALNYEEMTDEELFELVQQLRKIDEDEDEADEDNLEEAAKIVKLVADRGNVGALCDYGVFLMNGDGVEKDEAAAVACWEKAAEQNFAPALYKLGVCCLQGVCGLPKDESKAADYFTKAAEQGNADSMLNLSVLYSNGMGVEADPQKSNAYLEMAAEEGQPVACCVIGATLTSKADPKDWERGAKLLEQAAEAGNTEAQFFYGMCCEKARGVEQDLAEAAGWYRRAAKAGMPQANEALINLGFPGLF